MSLELTDRIKGKPELLRYCETNDGNVVLCWRATPGAQQYVVEKLNRETGAFVKIAALPEAVLEYVDEDVEAAQIYTYRIASKRIKKDGSTMTRRGAAQNVTLADPYEVFMTSATHPGFGLAVLEWERDDRADGYRVNRRPAGVRATLPLAYLEGQTLTFCDDTLVSGQIYYYSVQSFRKAEDDLLIFSHAGNEMMVVNLDETEVLRQKSIGRSVTFFVRVTAAADHYVLLRAETEDGDYQEVCRTKSGVDLKLTDRAPSGMKAAWYVIRCARDYEGTEYMSPGTKPVFIKF